MNLAQASGLEMLAKRGRQPITEKSRIVAHPELHKVLKYQGFVVQNTKPGQSTYVHPKTGAKATVKDTGDWNVTYPKPKELLPKGTKKIGAKPVGGKVIKPKGKALKPSTKMRVAAGGPGSGPHEGYARALMNIDPERVKALSIALAKLKPYPNTWQRGMSPIEKRQAINSGKQK